jgi:DNA polymerase-3 subunit alpha
MEIADNLMRIAFITSELALGEAAKFFPSDAALASWMAQAEQGQARIVYD